MSVAATTWVLRGGPDGGGIVIDAKPGDGVSALTCWAVLVVLADHANRDHLSWPALATIAACVRADTRTVRRALRVLERSGLIATVTPGGGRNRSAVYRLAVGNPDGAVRVSSSETRTSERETRTGGPLNPGGAAPRSQEPKNRVASGWRQVELADGSMGWMASPEEEERP